MTTKPLSPDEHTHTLRRHAAAEALRGTIDDASRVRTRAIDLAAAAADASHYLQTPAAVAVAQNAGEVVDIMRAASDRGLPVTFRSGGTSLSGQAVTDGILIDTRRAFRRVEVLDDGRRVRAEPGATLRQVNSRLARHGYRLGPDPASEAACTIGGVVANNSSGMSCGTQANAYRTIESLVFVLPSGTTIDSADPDADEQLLAREPGLHTGLLQLRDRIRANPRSVETIREAFTLKNTMGYAVNAFLDFDRPIDILVHLIVGSEGTLAFIANAVFNTLPVHVASATGLIVFNDLDQATAVLPRIIASGAAAVELMDSTSLRVGQRLSSPSHELAALDVTTQAALLIEYRAASSDELDAQVTDAIQQLSEEGFTIEFTSVPGEQRALWSLRKGLYAAVAGARASGTTALLEDVVVPVPRLAEVCRRLQDLLETYAYADSVIFGHAKDGNLHFMVTDRFSDPDSLTRLAEFTDELANVILGAGGNLKAEHGTGRAMTPFVRRQYGDELFDVMWQIKELCDPRGVLNPGVIIDERPDAHLHDIKHVPRVEEEIDRCVECGYCEPVCPSRDLTLTPRQRIAVRREMERARASGDTALLAELTREYDYDGVQTCAVDGMCQTACPVQIDTGQLVKRLRSEQPKSLSRVGWNAAAHAWKPFTWAGSTALTVADTLPASVVRSATDLGRALFGDDTMPRYDAGLPRGGRQRQGRGGLIGDRTASPSGIYLPACVNTMFGPEPESIGVRAALERLLERAGMSLLLPEGIDSLCCGTPWSSKGHTAGATVMAERVRTAVAATADGTSITIVSDAASCTEGFARELADTSVHVVDAIAFAAASILPRVTVTERLSTVTIHPTCSSTHLGITDDLLRIAQACADDPRIPSDWGCCGFAGDRGLLHPELTASATAMEAAEVGELGSEAHVSCNRTCEIGMTRATGSSYQHILEVLESATRPLKNGS